MTVGGDTYISDMMARGGLTNVFADEQRYPQASPNEARKRGAEAVLLSSEPYPFSEDDRKFVRAEIPDARCVTLVDGELFSWYGSRMRHAPAYLASLRSELERDAR